MATVQVGDVVRDSVSSTTLYVVTSVQGDEVRAKWLRNGKPCGRELRIVREGEGWKPGR